MPIQCDRSHSITGISHQCPCVELVLDADTVVFRVPRREPAREAYANTRSNRRIKAHCNTITVAFHALSNLACRRSRSRAGDGCRQFINFRFAAKKRCPSMRLRILYRSHISLNGLNNLIRSVESRRINSRRPSRIQQHVRFIADLNDLILSECRETLVVSECIQHFHEMTLSVRSIRLRLAVGLFKHRCGHHRVAKNGFGRLNLSNDRFAVIVILKAIERIVRKDVLCLPERIGLNVIVHHCDILRIFGQSLDIELRSLGYRQLDRIAVERTEQRFVLSSLDLPITPGNLHID